MTNQDLHNGECSWNAQKEMFKEMNQSFMIEQIEAMVKDKGADFVLNADGNKELLENMPKEARDLFMLGLRYLEYKLHRIKVGIICDNFKRNMFESELKKVGFDDFTVDVNLEKKHLLVIKVNCRKGDEMAVHKVCKIVELHFQRGN